MPDQPSSSSIATSSNEPGGEVLFRKKKIGARSLRKSQASTSSAADPGPSAPGPDRTATTFLRNDTDDEEENAGSDSAVIVKAKRKSHNPLAQSTLPSYKRLKQDGDENDDDFDLEDDDASVRGYLSKRRQTDRFGETAVASRFKAGGSASTDGLDKTREAATRHSNWDLEVDDAGKLKDRPTVPATATDKQTNDDGVYRGAKSYSSFVPTRDDGSSSKMRSRGPIRTTTNVRSVTVMDYQPDICKDYKETGYCGFGDTCKFLHDRSDYLAGWELDLLPNSNARRRGDLSDPEEAEDSEEEEIPFACLICRQPFTDPVVTNCGHYFCSSCAIKRYTKTSKCFACGAQTGGLFNSATKVLKRMEDAKKRKDEERSERRKMRGYDDHTGEGGEAQAEGDDDDYLAGGEILEGVEVGGSPE